MRTHGFTLVELVVVMILLSILSIGTMRFLTDSTSGYVSASERAELTADVRLALQRLNRELREALPNSPRISGNCLEFIPVVAASVYLTAPVGYTSQTVTLVPFNTTPIPPASRLAIPGSGNLYQLGAIADVSGTFTLAAPDPQNRVSATLSAPHQFITNSPRRRIYAVAAPVSFCVDGGSLWRYQNYGFQTAQPGPGLLPSTMPGRGLLVQQLDPAITPFALTPATLTRNAIVSVALHFQRGADTLEISHGVQLRNTL